jgi:indolepyruvate decarboxylase
MLATTYGVGELSALNGVMGAKAERSLVFHVVGMPSYQNQRLGKIAHHTLGNGVFGNFIELSAKAACCHAVIDPDNCVIELERVIGEARKQNQPAYIIVPSDYALFPVTPHEARPLRLKSSAAALKKAVAAIDERLRAAKSVVAFPAFPIARLGLQREAQKAIEALGRPFAVTSMEKCILDEGHPQFAGVYPEPRRRRPRARSSRVPIWCSISAASTSMTSPRPLTPPASTARGSSPSDSTMCASVTSSLRACT